MVYKRKNKRNGNIGSTVLGQYVYKSNQVDERYKIIKIDEIPYQIETDLKGNFTVEVPSPSSLFECFASFGDGNALYVITKFIDTSSVTSFKKMFFMNEELIDIFPLNYFNTSSATDFSYMFYKCKNLWSVDVSNFITNNVTTTSNMFALCENIRELDLSNWATTNITDVGRMFQDCYKLEYLNLCNWDMSNVTYMSYMFQNCDNLKYIRCDNKTKEKLLTLRKEEFPTKYTVEWLLDCDSDAIHRWVDVDFDSGKSDTYVCDGFDLYSAQKQQYSIDDGKTWHDVIPINLRKKDLIEENSELCGYEEIETCECESNAYCGYSSYDDFSPTLLVNGNEVFKANINNNGSFYKKWDGGTVTSIKVNNSKIDRIDAILNLSNVKDLSELFYMCRYVKSIPATVCFDTSSATDMSFMFYYCSSLISLDVSSFDTSNVTKMIEMFAFCEKIVSLDLSNFRTHNVTDMTQMFYGCSSLETLNLCNWDMSNVSAMYGMFYGCYVLREISCSRATKEKLLTLDYESFPTKDNITWVDCGNEETCRWVEVEFDSADPNTYICVGYDLYSVEKEQCSDDNGLNWYDSDKEPRQKDLIEENSELCGYKQEPIEPICRDIEVPFDSADPNTYICIGYDLYSIKKQECSYDNGETWFEIQGELSASTLIESNSELCGYKVLCEWFDVDFDSANPDTYICEDNTLYSVQKQMCSDDGGVTWVESGDTQIRKKDVIEYDSELCGYRIIYRWVDVPFDSADPNTYICDGTNLYSVQKQQWSDDDGANWHDVSPLNLRKKDLIERNSELCGYEEEETIYDWTEVDFDSGNKNTYICEGTNLYSAEKQIYSNDGGNTWHDVTPIKLRKKDLIEENSTLCGYEGPTYAWVDVQVDYDDENTYICDGYELWSVQRRMYSYGGDTWYYVEPYEENKRKKELMFEKSPICGYNSEFEGYVVDSYTSDTISIKINGKYIDADIDENKHFYKRYEGSYPQTVDFKVDLADKFKRIDKMVDISAVEDLSALFNIFRNLEYIDATKTMDTSSATDMTSMFNTCDSLKEIDLSNFNTSKVTKFTSMFNWCKSLTTLDLSNWNTCNVESLSSMFHDCEKLVSVNLANWDLTIAKHLDAMFYNCSSLVFLDLTGWKLNTAANINNMFVGCEKLDRIRTNHATRVKLMSLDEQYFPTKNTLHWEIVS